MGCNELFATSCYTFGYFPSADDMRLFYARKVAEETGMSTFRLSSIITRTTFHATTIVCNRVVTLICYSYQNEINIT